LVYQLEIYKLYKRNCYASQELRARGGSTANQGIQKISVFKMQCLPPPMVSLETSDLCLNYAQEFACTQGYAVSTERSKFKMYKSAFGEPIRQLQTAYLACCKGKMLNPLWKSMLI
jgi:hypothetical protein